MSQQFTVQSELIRDKLNSLLPSQNLGSIGVELTGSTQIVPIVDLTEVAEGSALRVDLQTSLSLASVTAFNVTGSTTTDIVTTTGYYRVFGTSAISGSLSAEDVGIQITDGTTTKILFETQTTANSATAIAQSFDFNVFLKAGDTLQAFSTNTRGHIVGCTRQIADLSGNLINPI